jgi:threonine dehydrogenase-like Zn-dependent dehydrogenase
MKNGDILGHEFMGVVKHTGSGVTKSARGDRVVIPLVIACGLLLLHQDLVCRLRNTPSLAAGRS